ncbi:hypothetical protein [Streptomyces sp. ISL-12]|nr:hypothetical protein [Streptomyces sp. ISL-12]
MLKDPYAVLRALLRAEASRRTSKPVPAAPEERQRPAPERERG